MATLQAAIAARLDAIPALRDDEPAGLGFTGVYTRWLTQEGPGKTEAAFTEGGRIRPSIVVWNSERAAHPSPNVPEWVKWDQFISIYLFHYPSDHGKDVLDRAIIEVEKSLCGQWVPIITGNQRPYIHPNPDETHIDDAEQFPGNYVIVLRFRVTGLRSAPDR